MINALVVDSLPMFCDGLCRMLKKIPGISRCDIAYNGKTALEAFDECLYDVVLMDLCLPGINGSEVTGILMKKFPHTKVIIVSSIDARKDVIEILQMGVSAYLLKSANEPEITEAVQQVLSGEIYMSEKIQKLWTDYVMNKSSHEKSRPGQVELSMREKEIIRLLCDQLTALDIANKLCISEATVKNHRANIMKKLETDNAIGIALYAVRTGLYIP
jgi:two-component system response regulator NreC